MSDSNDRPIGNTPITDAAAASAPSTPANDTTYPADPTSAVSSNADLRVKDEDDKGSAAMSPTGADIDNDHADERPVDRSQDAPSDFSDDKDTSERYTPAE